MAGQTCADDRALMDIEGREQGRGAVTFVVVGQGSSLTRFQRQTRLGAVQCLDLAFLIDRKHDGLLWRVEIPPDHISSFLLKLRVIRHLIDWVEQPSAVISTIRARSRSLSLTARLFTQRVSVTRSPSVSSIVIGFLMRRE